jgi:hypothetical protein
MNRLLIICILSVILISPSISGVFNPFETYNNINNSYNNSYISYNDHVLMQFQSIVYPTLLPDSLVDTTANEDDWFEMQELLQNAMQDFNIADTNGQRAVYNLFQMDLKDTSVLSSSHILAQVSNHLHSGGHHAF